MVGGWRHIGWLIVFFAPMVWGKSATDAPHAISCDEVTAVLSSQIQVSCKQVEFLFPASARVESPNLEAVQVKRTVFGGVSVMLKCSRPEECLPFYVLVHGLKLEGQDGKANKAITEVTKQRVVRRGQQVKLVLENRSMRLMMPAICLEDGARGQRIRTSSIDRKQVHEAEVIAPGVVRGEL